MTASNIEACSCDMFCPCYFNAHSTNHMSMGEQHMDEHFCRANLVLKVDKGHYKDTKLDGAKVWIGSDLGSDWSTGKDSWLVVNFDPSVSKEQQAALVDILTQLYSAIPFQKKAVSNTAFSWDVDTKTGIAHAKMIDGKAEVILERVKGDNPGHEVVIHNLKYWSAESNKSKTLTFVGGIVLLAALAALQTLLYRYYASYIARYITNASTYPSLGCKNTAGNRPTIFKAAALPQPHRIFICRHHKIKLHRPKPTCFRAFY